MAYLSAGVYVKEVDNSAIVPTVSNSVAFFAGNFTKGPIEQPFIITNKDELEFYFGQPTNKNYNEWFQCYKFFDYSNQLVVSRAFTEGNPLISKHKTYETYSSGTTLIKLQSIDGIHKGLKIGFVGFDANTYSVTNLEFNQTTDEYLVYLGEPLTDNIPVDTSIVIFQSHLNASIDAYRNYKDTDALDRIVPPFAQNHQLIKNLSDYETKEATFDFNYDVKLTFTAQTAGEVLNDIDIAICNPYDFYPYIPREAGANGGASLAQAFEGVSLLSLFEYPPVGEEIGVVIRKGTALETYICSFDKDAVDANNKSKYIENLINHNSKLVYVAVNDSIGKTTVTEEYEDPNDNKTYETYINSYIYRTAQGLDGLGNLSTFGGESPLVSVGDIKDAYFEVEDKEVYEIDVVIGNEYDNGVGAGELANTRADCIAFLGARYEDVVGKKSAVAVDNLLQYMNSSDAPLRTMFSSFFGNYFRIYDNYAKKFRWINVAGDMAGLRSNTNSNNASWWASAGLRRGVIRNIDKIAFSPNLAQRDALYRNSINPIVSFPGEGNLVWGQKTLLNYASSFDRINVRGLFNTIERAMAKASRSTLFEFNDPFTRNAVLAMFNPYLSSVKAGRGIQDFLVVCDETNNTPEVIARNELRVDIYIKPNYATEFIILTFNNVGTRSFSSVIGA